MHWNTGKDRPILADTCRVTLLDCSPCSSVPELHRLARTLDPCHTELLAAFTPTGRRRASNGSTEAVNALIKKVKRVGHRSRRWHQPTGRASCASPAWTGPPSSGRLPLPPRFKETHHAWWRRAANPTHQFPLTHLPRQPHLTNSRYV